MLVYQRVLHPGVLTFDNVASQIKNAIFIKKPMGTSRYRSRRYVHLWFPWSSTFDPEENDQLLYTSLYLKMEIYQTPKVAIKS